MLELVNYLREKDPERTSLPVVAKSLCTFTARRYTVFRRSGGGSSIVTKYEVVKGKPELMREPKVFLIDNGPGKAIGINLFIG